MDRFAAHLGHDAAARVTPKDFIAFKETLLRAANANEMSHTTVGNIITAVKSVFGTGQRARKIETNPTAGSRTGPKSRRRARPCPTPPNR
jgi:hypothetical protein